MVEQFHLLIAEDDPDEILILEMLFKKHFPHWVYYFVNDWKQLMAFLESKASVSVLLLDMNLPEKDGISIVRDIRKIDTYTKLPIVGFSSKSSRTRISDLILEGANGFFEKPFTVEQMVELLQKLPAFSTNGS